MKLGWNAVFIISCTIALTLEGIHVILYDRCNHQNNRTTVSFLKTIPKMLPVHGEIDIPKDLCAYCREFSLRPSNERVNIYISSRPRYSR